MKRLMCSMVCLLAALGCQPDDAPIDTAGVEPPTSWNAIPKGQPAGRIHGVDFEAKSARIYVNEQPGRQWVTLSLSAATSEEPCGKREPEKAPSVWIRIPGTVSEALAPRELKRAASDEEGWSVHYQVPEDGEPWIGHGHASALFAVRRYVAGFGIDAELSACFADGMGSCLSGTFTARLCPNPVSPDVRTIDPSPSMKSKPKPSAATSSTASAAASSAAPAPSASASIPLP